MTITAITAGLLALLSLGLTLWQWALARRFPLHQGRTLPGPLPGVSVLKPLKGCDANTRLCLATWLDQRYDGPIQFLFAVASPDDPVCPVVRELLAHRGGLDASLIVCESLPGPNLKVSKLARLEAIARHPILAVSDADVAIPPGMLSHLAAELADPKVGLVNPFYRFVGASTTAMKWEAFAVNADFWGGVLQSRALSPLKFALGAVMAVRRECVTGIGGFAALEHHIADDYELGRRVAGLGRGVVLCPVLVECHEAPQGWASVWRHQTRWARTIRACQPGPYGASIVSNATLWPLLWAGLNPTPWILGASGLCLLARLLTARDNLQRFEQGCATRSNPAMAFLKDILQVFLWASAFLGSSVEWRGVRYRIRHDGKLIPVAR